MGDLVDAVAAALDAHPVDPRDQAAMQLARTYAAAIDDGGDLAKLGPALLATLDALRLTVRARTGKAGDDARPAANPLDELRERRRRRLAGTAAVDTPAAGADP